MPDSIPTLGGGTARLVLPALTFLAQPPLAGQVRATGDTVGARAAGEVGGGGDGERRGIHEDSQSYHKAALGRMRMVVAGQKMI